MMNKQDLIRAMQKRMPEGTTLKTIEAALNAFIDCITEALQNDEEVILTGFGSFKVSKREARMGRNPQTGESITIAASSVPSFKPGKNLKDAVNSK